MAKDSAEQVAEQVVLARRLGLVVGALIGLWPVARRLVDDDHPLGPRRICGIRIVRACTHASPAMLAWIVGAQRRIARRRTDGRALVRARMRACRFPDVG